MNKLVVAFGFLFANFYVYNFLANTEVYPERQRFASFPAEIGEWRCPGSEEMEPAIIRRLQVSDYLLCNYQRPDGAVANVYVGYHRSQVRSQGGESSSAIHPPKHCLPGSGWDIIQTDRVNLDFDGLPDRPVDVTRFLISKGKLRQQVYYWYQSRGRVITQDYAKILYQFWDRALRNRTDGALVRFTVPVRRGDFEEAEATFRDLAPQVVALLPEYLPE